jgi:channel protein (hemolysin III family)
MNLISIPGFSDPFSAISHLLGVLVALYYGVKLIRLTTGQHGLLIAVSVSVFVFTVVFLLSMSGGFHLLEHESMGRAILQRLDHAGIFALIAGTFTPIHCILFKGFWRWGFLLLIWALAITGITLKTIFFNEFAEWLGLVFYLGLGWLGILSAYLTHRLHGFSIIKPLLYGALAYTAGASLEFLQLPTVISGVIGPHELFHIAVLVGITWHWQFVKNLLMLKQDF